MLFIDLREPFVGLKGPSFGPRNSCVDSKTPVRTERALLRSAIYEGPLSAREAICRRGRACAALRGRSYGRRSK